MNIKGFTLLKSAIKNTKPILDALVSNPGFYSIDNKAGRRICQYGYKYDYLTETCVKTTEIPQFYLDIINPVLQQQKIECKFNQVLINEYQPGQGIAPHVDANIFGDTIVCLTINSGAVIKFERREQEHEFYVDNGDVYIMQSEARYDYKHSQPARKKDQGYGPRGVRYSITYRFYAAQ